MKYIVPFSYGLLTRTKTIFYKISFFAVIVLPIFIVSMFSEYDIVYILPRFILGFVSMYSIYEIGYIFNDTYTIRFEENPTYRLNPKERLIVDRWANLLISVRLLTVIISCILLYYLGVNNLIYFILMLGLLDVSYALHNFYRSKKNIFTIFLILVFKYSSIPILFMTIEEYISYFMWLVLSVPILRTIEFAAKPSYGIKLFVNFNHDEFRVYYYAFITFVLFMLRKFDYDYFTNVLILFSYFLLFRVICLLAIKSKVIKAARRHNTKI